MNIIDIQDLDQEYYQELLNIILVKIILLKEDAICSLRQGG